MPTYFSGHFPPSSTSHIFEEKEYPQNMAPLEEMSEEEIEYWRSLDPFPRPEESPEEKAEIQRQLCNKK